MTESFPERERPIHPKNDAFVWISRYLTTLRSVLTKPVDFFRSMPIEGGLGGPLAFALITHWIGSALSFMTGGALSSRMDRYVSGFRWVFQGISGDQIDRLSRSSNYQALQERLSNWMFSAGRVIVDPFLTLAFLLFTAAFVYLGARIFVTPSREGELSGGPRAITFESAARVVAYASAPAILDAIPYAGGALASLLTLVFMVIGARETYRIGTGRAILVGLFPRLFFVGLGAIVVLALIFFALKLMSLALF